MQQHYQLQQLPLLDLVDLDGAADDADSSCATSVPYCWELELCHLVIHSYQHHRHSCCCELIEAWLMLMVVQQQQQLVDEMKLNYTSVSNRSP